MLERVAASCTVTDLGARYFEVIVTGAFSWSDHVRTYAIKGKNEDDAAQQGLRAFENEMECLRDAGPVLRVN